MAETLTCPHCGGALSVVGLLGPCAEDYAAVAFARCVRLGCGEAMLLDTAQPGLGPRKIPPWRAARARARAREALRTIVRAFTELWCLPACNVIERGVILVMLEICLHLELFALRLHAHHFRRPEATLAWLSAWHLRVLFAPLVVCLLAGLVVAVVGSILDALLVRRLARGELRRAELRAVRSDYR